MSLARKSASDAAAYRLGYLRSAAWAKRRAKYYAWIRGLGKVPVCQVCGTKKDLQLHHLSYEGVRFDASSGQWVAGESNDDFLPLCALHHEGLHRAFDTKKRDFIGAQRRWASLRWVNAMRSAGQRRKG